MKNKDRHLCKTCKYRAGKWEHRTVGYRCDYICIVGHSRGCPAENCNRYEKGKRQKPKKQITLGV